MCYTIVCILLCVIRCYYVLLRVVMPYYTIICGIRCNYMLYQLIHVGRRSWVLLYVIMSFMCNYVLYVLLYVIRSH